jgi:hypothetical protein
VVRKVQIPVVGGIRKVVTVTPPVAGTTIAEFGSGTVTLAQLRAALGTITVGGSSGGSSGGSAPPAALALGPGLSGGGPMIGAVSVRLTAPIPANLDDHVCEESIPIPGPAGPVGPQGPAGPALFVLADDPVEDVVFILTNL